MENDLIPAFGASIQSPEDYRYITVEHLAGAAPAEASALPASFHIDYSKVPDMYQRQIGACTCHATAELFTKRQNRLTGEVYQASPRFLYALCKVEDGVAGEDNGTYPVMPLKMAVKYGVASEKTVPNDTTLSFEDYIYHRTIGNIPEIAFAEADKHRIPGYAQVGGFNSISATQLMQGIVNSVDGVKTCLPVGAEWYTSVHGQTSWSPADILPIRKMVERISGHDITVTGYEIEATSGRLKVFFRNHWSLNWADQDTGWFYLDQHTLSEAWIVTEIPDALLALVKSLPAKSSFKPAFARDLKPGMTGPDVKNLQIALKIVGTFPFTQNVTEYFGPLTAKAVMDFQREYHVATEAQIVAANGEAGPKTTQALTKLLAK